MSMKDAISPVVTRYVHAVQASGDGQWRVRSATFWLSLGLDRGTDAHIALVRSTFLTHGIAVSTSTGELGHEPPDAWIELMATASIPDRGTSISDLPDSLFGDVPVPVDPWPDSIGTDEALSEPPSVAISSTVAQSPTAGLSQPAATTSGSVAPQPLGRWGDGSTDTSALVVCPSCSATVLLSALFCPVCGLPQTSVREGLRQRAANTGETHPASLKHVRDVGWPLPDTPRQRLTLPPGTSVVIGIVVLAIGARLGDLLMPLLVLSAMAVLGVSVWKPDILDALMGRGTSRHGQDRAGVSVMQIAVVVAVIIAMYLISSRTAMVSTTGGTFVP